MSDYRVAEVEAMQRSSEVSDVATNAGLPAYGAF